MLRTKKAEYQAISLNVIVLRMRLRRSKNITNSANGLNHLLGEVLVYFVPQATNEHVHHVRLRIEAVAPNVFEDHRFGNNSAGVAHEIFEQRELSGLKIQPVVGASDFPRQ